MSQPPQENPLKERLSPQQFQHTVEFYEADQKLNHDDRIEMAQQLRDVITGSSYVSYGAGFAMSTLPTLYYQFLLRKPINTKRFVQRPFISFLFGLSGLVTTRQYALESQLRNKEANITNPRIQQVWKILRPTEVPLFYFYYIQSAKDPSIIAKDPRGFTKEMFENVRFDPELAKRAAHKGKDPRGELGGMEESHPSHWDELRQESGLVTPAIQNQYGDSPFTFPRRDDRENDDPFSFADQNILSPESGSKDDTSKSSWDAIRRGQGRN
ncbi:uncharacterized protein J8A68_001494 [[Candida] subhashii]|uniref:Uncharacterized protein n=1 Tax=[Candida] subhashii TaxID=561895 RepID=A0A8J5UQS0_9ASCO|nr:uncharacterized protein J8A68_001494 [[Candida] subhashii]KAG7664966.1 hypothetical protein J8A68_001494 [[Candida] subhashii]